MSVPFILEPQPFQQVGKAWDGWDAIGAYHEASDSVAIFLAPVAD